MGRGHGAVHLIRGSSRVARAGRGREKETKEDITFAEKRLGVRIDHFPTAVIVERIQFFHVLFNRKSFKNIIINIYFLAYK